MSADQYLGIDRIFTASYKKSGSKFHGFLFPVASIDDFDDRIKAYRAEFPDATHVCSAAVIGMNREVQRFSDDGEPGNSAGRPILHALLSSNTTFVGCAVVRYYGGKKLGIPGLIEAYGGTAQLCLDEARIIELIQKDEVLCTIDPQKSYLLYNFAARHPDVEMIVTDDQFKLICSKSMTQELRSGLLKIDTLVLQK